MTKGMGLEHEKQIVAIKPKLPPGTLRQGLNTLRFNNGVEDLEVTSNARGNLSLEEYLQYLRLIESHHGFTHSPHLK